MTNQFKLHAAALLCSVSMLAMPQLAMAAENTASDSDEILVTATRDTRSLQEVPMSVNVATGEQLQKLRIFDVKDISQLAPGLELTNNSGRNNTATLRGMSFDPDQGTSPTVQVYYNEIPADAQTVFTAMYDIGQIEILRGPQGLLRGVSAPGGSITIATRRPNFDKAEGYFQASATTRAGYNIQGGASFPLSDKLAIRVAGLVDGNRLNQVRNFTRNNEYSKSRTESGRITLGFKPSDNFTGYLSYQYLHARNNQFQQVLGNGNTPELVYREVFGTPSFLVPPAFGGGPFAVDTTVRSGPASTVDDYRAVTDGGYEVETKSNLLNLNLTWDLGGATVFFIAGHQRSTVETRRDEDLGNAVPGFNKLSFVHVPYNVDTQELRIASNNREGFGWSVGAYHSRQTGDVINDPTSNLFAYAVAPSTAVKVPLSATFVLSGQNMFPLAVHVLVPLNIETWSINGNLRYKSGPLTIEGGIRYTERKNVQTTQLSTTGTFPGTTSAPREIVPADLQDIRDKPITGGLTIDYAINDNTNIYFAYGHSARAGSTGVSTPVGVTRDIVRSDPERTDSFELGIKGSAMDRKLRYSVTGFYQKFNGYIRRFDGIFWKSAADPSGSGVFSFNYNGDAQIYGIEATLDGKVTPNWDVNLNMAYSHARYSKAKLPCNDYAGTGIPNQTGAPTVTGSGNVSYCLSSGRIAEVPDFSLTANTEVRFPMGNVTPFIGAVFTYRPGFFSDIVQYKYQDRELLNMFVGVRGPEGKWEISGFVRNLFNQHRVTNISLGNQQQSTLFQGAGGGFFDSGYRMINATTPREFGITGSFKF